MKTAHQLARELLAGPDLPIFHFDPSRAGMDEEADTATSDPIVEIVKPDDETVKEPFITICGDNEGEEAQESVPLNVAFAARLLMSDPETHEELRPVADPVDAARDAKNSMGGGYELIVANKSGTRKWKHTIRTEEV